MEEEPDKPNQPPKIVVFATGRDSSIREVLNGNSRSKYETGHQYSCLRLMHGHKAFFAGVQSSSQAGSIHVVPYPFDEGKKINEVQIHGAPVSRMTLNYEHSLLFSGSEDGSLAFIAITDRPKGSIKDISHIKEVLIHGKV